MRLRPRRVLFCLKCPQDCRLRLGFFLWGCLSYVYCASSSLGWMDTDRCECFPRTFSPAASTWLGRQPLQSRYRRQTARVISARLQTVSKLFLLVKMLNRFSKLNF